MLKQRQSVSISGDVVEITGHLNKAHAKFESVHKHLGLSNLSPSTDEAAQERAYRRRVAERRMRAEQGLSMSKANIDFAGMGAGKQRMRSHLDEARKSLDNTMEQLATWPAAKKVIEKTIEESGALHYDERYMMIRHMEALTELASQMYQESKRKGCECVDMWHELTIGTVAMVEHLKKGNAV